MDFPPHKRVDGARALARAFVLQAEALTRIKNLTRPMYTRLRLVDSNNVVAQVHAICREVAWAITEEDPSPMPTNKFAPMKNKFWTAHGKSERDEIHVGIFQEKKDAARWCDRQNETQHSQEWGRGSAGPMHFVPKPLYNDPGVGLGAPDPKRAIYPERTWDESDAD